MWKRDQGVRTTGGREALPGASPAQGGPPATGPAHAGAETDRRMPDRRDVASIGKSVIIHGELSGSEDLTIEGSVDGRIELKDHILTIGPNGRIKAQIFAKGVVVLGQVFGNVTASEKVDIRDNGSVEGDILAPRIAIAEGANFRGSVDMQKKVELPWTAPPASPLVSAAPAAPVPALLVEPDADLPPKSGD